MKAICQRPCHGLAVREIVVAVVVLGLLLILLMPWLLDRQTTARRRFCVDRQRRLWQATLQFEELNQQYPGYRVHLDPAQQDTLPAVSWAGAILPFLAKTPGIAGEPPLTQVERFLDADPQTRGKLATVYLPEFVCPTDVRVERRHGGIITYIANTGMPDAPATANAPADWPANGVLLNGDDLSDWGLKPNSRVIIEAYDGTDQTLLFSENADAGLWTDALEPSIGFVWIASFINEAAARDARLLGINESIGQGDGGLRFARPASRHGRGVNVVYCSGRFQFLADDIDYAVFANLMNSDVTATQAPGSNEPLTPPYHLDPQEDPMNPRAEPIPPQQ